MRNLPAEIGPSVVGPPIFPSEFSGEAAVVGDFEILVIYLSDHGVIKCTHEIYQKPSRQTKAPP